MISKIKHTLSLQAITFQNQDEKKDSYSICNRIARCY